MHEILKNLPCGSRVLDLGCNAGSFASSATQAEVVRIDREPAGPGAKRTNFVQTDSARLPFADQSFDAVISNHSLEHFDDLNGALQEIRRVITRDGSLFVAVPDASTLTDKVYRWLARGGGHVNAFTSATETATAIADATALTHVATRPLYSSLSFLNRRNSPRPRPRRLLLLGAGYEWSLFLYVWLSRRLDRFFGTRTGVYGWAFYFGKVAQPIDAGAWVNVCIRCGRGHSAGSLKKHFGIWRCSECGAANPFAEDPVTAGPGDRGVAR
ncbi:MAG TPA: class I SAM-dependent methyltransferase [Bryobacteraceae bacterium]|nr:class I SAM-dependent methyltransferase [Bryobacteraceae bacterium]